MCNVCVALEMLGPGLIVNGFDGKEYEFKAVGEKPEFTPVKWTMRPADQPWKDKWIVSDDLAGTASLLNLDSPVYCLTFQNWLFWKESLKELGYIDDYEPLGKNFEWKEEMINILKEIVKNVKKIKKSRNFKKCDPRDAFFSSLTEKDVYKIVLFIVALNSPYNFIGITDAIEKNFSNAFPDEFDREIIIALIKFEF